MTTSRTHDSGSSSGEDLSAANGMGACPGVAAFEQTLATGPMPKQMAEHVAGCAMCRANVEMVRENLMFMRAVLGGEAPGARSGDLATEGAGDGLGEELAGYTLVRQIARGGQGVVYEAVQNDTKRHVALKMIEPERGGVLGGNKRRRIEREAELASSLRHPNIVSVYHTAALKHGRFAIAMEYVDGVVLDEWAAGLDAGAGSTREGHRAALMQKLRAMVQVCDAVQHAHDHGVIHRDLKPANVLVTGDGTPRVVDFGVATRTTNLTQLTRAGGFAGTLAYAAPEQLSGDRAQVDTRCDVYALGIMLYEVLSGRAPYDTGGSLTGAIEAITRGPVPQLESVQPGNTPAGTDLRAIVGKAMSKDREARYRSAAELAEDLRSWMDGGVVRARPATAWYLLRKLAARHRVGAATGAVIVALGVGLGGTMALSSYRLSKQRELLASALTSSLVQRGRLIGLSGENAQAEELIWPEFVRAGGRGDEAGLLFDGPPDVMQAAWALTELYSRQPSLMHRRVPKAGTDSIARLEADGKRLTLLCGDHVVRTLSVPDGRLLAEMPIDPIVHAGQQWPSSSRRHVISRVQKMPDGSSNLESDELAIVPFGTKGPTVRLREASFRHLLYVEVNRDVTRLATVDLRGTSRLFAIEAPDKLRLITILAQPTGEPPSAFYNRVLLSADEALITSTADRSVFVHTVADGRLAGTWRVPDDIWGSIVRPAFIAAQASPQAKKVVAVIHNRIVVFDYDSPSTPPVVYPQQPGHVNNIIVDLPGKTMLSTSQDRTMRTWDLATGQMLGSMGHAQIVSSMVQATPDGRLAALADVEGAVRVYETRARQWAQMLPCDRPVQQARFSPDGTRVAACTARGEVRMYRQGDRSLVWKRTIADTPIEALAYGPDGKMLAAGIQTGEVEFMDAATGEELGKRVMTNRLVTWAGFSPDGRWLATAAGTTIDVFDVENRTRLLRLEGHERRAIQGVFSKDGRFLASVGQDGQTIIWSLPTGTVQGRIPHPTGAIARAVALSPDGELLAVGSDDWKIRLYRFPSGELVKEIGGAKQHVFGMAFHPRGRLLFVCGRSSVVQVFDVRTGQELAALDGHGDIVMSVDLDVSGRYMATASVDQQLGVWDLDHYRTHIQGNEGFWREASGVASGP